MTEQNKNELVALGKRNPLEIFTETEMDKLLRNIREKSLDAEIDLSTEKGRKDIASRAYKVSRSKTALVEMGKKLTEEAEKKTKAVKDVVSIMKNDLDDLRDEVRQPLTDWEDAEKVRIAKHKENIDNMRESGEHAATLKEEYTVAVLKKGLGQLEAIAIDDSWQEFEGKAQEIKSIAVDRFNIAIQKREIIDKEQAELKRLREAEKKRQEEDAERERLQAEKDAQDERERIAEESKARIEKERADAAEKARLKAEEAARIVAAEKEQLRRDEADRLEKEKQDAIDAKELAEQQVKDAEKATKEAAEQAAANERQKIKDEENQRLADKKRREDDKDHKVNINIEAVDGLVKSGLEIEHAKIAIRAIILGEVPNVKINY